MSTTTEATTPKPIEVGSHRSLCPAHLRELTASGITPETAVKAGIYSEHDRKKLAELVGWKSWSARMGSAIVYPYRDAEGREQFSRVKPDNAPDRNGKPLKYSQPKGVQVRCYFPPGVREDVAAGSVRLLITEGEKKSLSATQRGFPTIGLPGVNAWCRKQSTTLNADLAAINWGGRKVFIVFDSDAVDNSSVALEEQKLAMALEREGAIVKVVRLPPGPPDSAGEPTKAGLDDHLVAYGPGDLERLIEEAQPAELPTPGSLKVVAGESDPAEEAERILQTCTQDDEPRIRFYQGMFWYWIKGAYRELPECDLRSRVTQHYSQYYSNVSASYPYNCLEHIKAQTHVLSYEELPIWLNRNEFDPEASECVSFKNGILHLPSFATGDYEFIESTPRFFTTCKADFDFVADPPEPTRWLAFLESVFGDDQQSAELLQEWFGYCLTPDTCQQKALFVVGPKRSGKGTIARVLTAMLGKGNVAAPTLGSLAERFGLQPLVGKPLAIIHDARLSGRSDQAPIVERLLSITGEDSQSVDRKFHDPVTCKLPTRFAIMSNELPRLADSSGALVGRLLLLETPNSFYGREDHSLTDDLLAELPGVFQWAVEGWLRLRKRGRFQQPDAALERLQDLADLSSPVGEFIRDRCELTAEGVTQTQQVYTAYQSWCMSKGVRPSGDTVFGRDLQAAAPGVRRQRIREGDARPYFYVGLRLLAGSEWS